MLDKIKHIRKMNMNPILKKELRLGSRSIRIPLAVMFYDIVLAAIAVINIAVVSMGNRMAEDINFSGYLSVFQVIGWTQLGITMLIVPILTAGSIAGEREKQTLEIMLTTPKKPITIICGKLLASLSNYLIFVISSIPIMAIAFVLGGMNWFALLGYIVMVIVLAVYLGSIGVFCSSVFKKTIISIVMSFLLEGLILSIPFCIFFGVIIVVELVAEIYNDAMLNTAAAWWDPNFGILPLILTVHPLTGFFDYMMRVMNLTSISEILKSANCFGKIMPILANAWIPLNIICSGGISYFFLRMAAKSLNPLKKGKKKKIAAQNRYMQAQQKKPAGVPPQEQAQLYQPQQPPANGQATQPPVPDMNGITERLTQPDLPARQEQKESQ